MSFLCSLFGGERCNLLWWCYACVDSKPTIWESEIFQIYNRDTSLGLTGKRAYKYQVSESQDPLDMVISCGQIEHAKFYEKEPLIRTHW